MKPRKTKGIKVADLFPKAYVAHGGNGAAAYRSIRPNVTAKTATVEGSLTLAKPSVQQRIQELLQAQGLTVELAMSTHKRNMVQNKHLPTSQKAVETVYQLAGMLKHGDNTNTVNIGIYTKE